MLFGLGNHSDTTIGVMRLLGEAGGALIMAKFLWDSFRGRLAPMTGLGIGMGAFVLLGGTVLPWYLLWAIVPLAAAIGTSRFRTWAAVLSVFFSLITPPTGSNFDGHLYVLPESWVAAIVVVVLALFVVRRRIPIWHGQPA
jgi:alpha-1,6-mannosyltransferase